MKRFSKEVKIGATFLISVALLYIGVNFLKGSSVFSHYSTYYTVVSNTGGIAVSSVVTANGYQVGTVSRVEYDYARPERIVLAMRVNEALRIPKGTHAFLVNSLMGGVSIELRLAQSAAYYADGDTLPSGVADGLTGQIENVMLPQVNALVPKVDSLITALTTLVANPALEASISNVESISAKLNHTAGELNRLFHDELPLLVTDLQGTARNVNKITSELATVDYAQTIARVDSAIAGLQTLSEALTSDRSSIGRLLGDTAFYNNLNEVCTNANALIEDVKTHPSRYINISVFGKK